MRDLRKELNISDFVCRGEYGMRALDAYDSYYLTSASVNSGVGGKMREQMRSSGVDPDLLAQLIEADPSLIEKTISGNINILEDVKDDELPDDVKAEYLKNVDLIERGQKTLQGDKAMPTDKRIELQTGLETLMNKNLEMKRKVLEGKMKIDPQMFARNPQVVAKLISAISKREEIKPIHAEEKRVLNTLMYDFLENFLLCKGYEQQEVKDIRSGVSNKALSVGEMQLLMKSVFLERENGLEGKSLDFFTNTPSSNV